MAHPTLPETVFSGLEIKTVLAFKAQEHSPSNRIRPSNFTDREEVLCQPHRQNPAALVLYTGMVLWHHQALKRNHENGNNETALILTEGKLRLRTSGSHSHILLWELSGGCRAPRLGPESTGMNTTERFLAQMLCIVKAFNHLTTATHRSLLSAVRL